MEDKNNLGSAPVGKLMVKLAIPAVCAQLINALYNIVDRMYIGHMEEVGDLALTGLGVAFPIIMFISALSALAGMGGGSRAAIRMGEGDIDGAEAILGGCTALLLMMAALSTALFQVFKEPLLLLFGASENTLPYASGYLSIYLWGTVSVLFSLGLNNFITTQGFAAFSMLTVVIGAVCNIILDPIFIFGLHMGVQGAALATILSQSVSAAWVLSFLLGRRTLLHLRLRHLRLRAEVLLPVVAIGVSPFIMQATESLVSISFNSSLKLYGGDPYVGAMTIASSVMQVGTMPLHGLAQGAQPIIGFNFGAGNLDRVRRAFRLLFISCLAFTVTIWALVELFPGVFIAIFNDKPALTEIARRTLQVYFGGIFMFGVQSSCQQTFVALGEAKISLFLALLRKIILLIPLIFILPLILSDQVFAVWLAEPIADICAATVTGCIFFYRFPRTLKRREETLRHGRAQGGTP
ncbi:MATE family efflux transporter [Vermiculatibacterium agrestimuris]|uniref:MATE family efflux transporter n=1 Tax=Vermiculatibacterium agrestimuris TaxID=2941519 RepID=UPI00203D6ABA|nr:MATE family efflux transporter [Vermiculatibacterium agrestimuris]